ncbi:MAG TPA: hypothetical protein DEQ20_05710 [Desulfobulbaceae bacterium]|nr:MAG: hypothetical protein A2520_07130 [Deltaproteobacteria bacterium RIFOXYD12_FULL_53_23]HCC54406.1 hypothetical protein [Desulfobulbaceae bacterium]
MKSFSFAPRTMSRKIVAVIIITTLTATLTLIPALFFILRDGMRDQRQRHLAGVRHMVAQLIEENQRTVKNYAVLFATDRQLKDNLYYYAELAGEREHPANAVHHLRESFGLQHIELGDRQGRVVVDATRPARQDEDMSADPLVSKAMAGEVVVGIEPHQDGFLLKGVAPIYHDEGQLIGTITTGLALNNEFAAMIKGLSGAEIAIADRNGRIIAASLPALLGKTEPVNMAGFSQGGYQVMALPFVDIRQRPLGQVVIMIKDPLPAILRQATMAMISILLGISFLSIMATVFILRRVLAPIAELRAGAEKIGRGHFEHRLPVVDSDELGSLAEAFNSMAANLQHKRVVEEKLKHAERLASIGEFTAATAHELNNPIANIIGLIKVVRKDLPVDNPLVEDLDLLVKEASRCGAIVRDLLVYSRSSRPNLEAVDLNLLIQETILAVSPRYLKNKDIHLDFLPIAPDQARLVADPVQIGQVLSNLLINAAQAITGPGEITIRVTVERPDHLTVSIADTGCGILPEHLDKIFYPFFTTKKTGDGTGLGLAVCYTIIQSHNGSIEAIVRPGGGSVFTITLPREQP